MTLDAQNTILDPSRPDLQIPQELQQVLRFNPHLIHKFVRAVEYAIDLSFDHPDTKLRGEIRESERLYRKRMCHQAIIFMYQDQKWSLNQSLECLPTILIDALRMGTETHKVSEGHVAGRWAVDAPQEEVVQETANLNEETN